MLLPEYSYAGRGGLALNDRKPGSYCTFDMFSAGALDFPYECRMKNPSLDSHLGQTLPLFQHTCKCVSFSIATSNICDLKRNHQHLFSSPETSSLVVFRNRCSLSSPDSVRRPAQRCLLFFSRSTMCIY